MLEFDLSRIPTERLLRQAGALRAQYVRMREKGFLEDELLMGVWRGMATAIYEAVSARRKELAGFHGPPNQPIASDAQLADWLKYVSKRGVE